MLLLLLASTLTAAAAADGGCSRCCFSGSAAASQAICQFILPAFCLLPRFPRVPSCPACPLPTASASHAFTLACPAPHQLNSTLLYSTQLNSTQSTQLSSIQLNSSPPNCREPGLYRAVACTPGDAFAFELDRNERQDSGAPPAVQLVLQYSMLLPAAAAASGQEQAGGGGRWVPGRGLGRLAPVWVGRWVGRWRRWFPRAGLQSLPAPHLFPTCQPVLQPLQVALQALDQPGGSPSLPASAPAPFSPLHPYSKGSSDEPLVDLSLPPQPTAFSIWVPHNSTPCRYVLRRRMRILTAALPLADTPQQLYAGCDAEATACLVVHKVMEGAASAGTSGARQMLLDWLVLLAARVADPEAALYERPRLRKGEAPPPPAKVRRPLAFRQHQ